jgi:hypothetical protein
MNMPYIKKEDRATLDNIVDMMMLQGDMGRGKLNYMIFKFVKEYMKQYGESYSNYQKIIGELECSKQEIIRRLLSPYEDKKIKENGDVK